MSISPPSDIILDVAQAADPLKRQAATTRLAARAASEAGATTSFDAALQGTGTARPTGATLPSLHPPGPSHVAAATSRKGGTGQKFEAMVLQTFIENILPKNAELFGDAASADMGRSLLAEQIANQLAKSGRLGIAKSLERSTDAAPQAAALPTVTPEARRG